MKKVSDDMTEIMQIIINNCKLRDISQRELAKRSGLTEASISRYFNGERTPNLRNAERMANVLGLRLALIKNGKVI